MACTRCTRCTLPMYPRARSKSWIPISVIKPPTPHFRIAELDGWRVGIARNGGEHHRLTDSAFFDCRLCRQVPGIETALKGHLKEHSCSFHRCNHLACAIQGQRDRLLAKDCLSTPCRIYDF